MKTGGSTKVVIFFILLFTVPASPSCSLPFVSVKTKPDGYLVGKGLFILIFVCVVGKNDLLCCVFVLSHLVSILGLSI